MSLAKKKTILILDWTKMPKAIKQEVQNWGIMGKDGYFSIRSEFSVDDFRRGRIAVEEYHKDQTETNGYKGTVEQFIEDYNLRFD